MRLLFVHNYPIWDRRSGGGQRVNHELATHAVRAGHEVRVLHVGTGGADAPVLEYETDRIIESPHLAVNAVRLARAVRALARSWRPDAVHGSSAEAGLVPRLLPKGVGLMATMHHPDPPPLPPLRWVAPIRTLADVRRFQNAWLHAALLRGAHDISVPSEWSRRALIEGGYVAHDRPVVVIPNGVGDAWFREREREPTPDAPTDVLFVGRLDEQKGVDVLLRALATPALADVSVRLVGTGPDEGTYRRLAEELGLGERARFAGPLSHAHIRRLTTRSRVFALPSRRESFGMAILEAMAAGLPVVATTAGGIPEFAHDGVNALLVRPGNVDDLAAALRRLLDDPPLRNRLAAEGREVAEVHRWEHVTERFLERLHLAAELARPMPPVPRRPGAGLYRGSHARLGTMRAPRAQPLAVPAEAARVAVVRFGFLGDFILLDPLLAVLEERFAGASFDLVVDAAGHVPPWMAGRPDVEVLPLAVRTDQGWSRPGDAALEASLGALANRWREAPPDVLVFSTQLDGPIQEYLGARIASLAPGAWRGGLSGRHPGLPFLHRSAPPGPPDWHEIDRLLSIAAFLDASSRFRLPRVPRGGDPGLAPFDGPTVVVHPGASWPQKRWMPERFGSLLRTLREQEGARAVLVGSDAEAARVGDLGVDVEGSWVVDRTGRTTLEELRDLIAAADLFVGNDSFPFHLAVALARPAVVLVGPGAARYYGYPEGLATVVREPVVCSPRHGEECPFYTVCPHAACMQAIREVSVVAACRRLLRPSSATPL
jgi:glycosyltransferase involved in cell wall biosynthesis/ADP-heptose:LPS heptosyltransferase